MIRRNTRARAETVTPYGKSLPVDSSAMSGQSCGLKDIKTHQGIPSRICVCTVINHAKIPKQVDAATKTIRIHKFSCTSGHW